ncbi:MAG: transglutaminase family protein [Corynebacterium sp.]|uniref:transglutaminase-like domain-containing protein n=1 Tax=Corynebacterium sp. TaxID=1720 RepID=UPI0026DF606D|nr:transglutaminase family protein [Corynebacterium sp.]MDO5670312.1 transglutaminase family protein [Corynebacterium sp.]
MHLEPEFLAPTTIIDAEHPDITALAHALTGTTPPETMRAIFAYVRDKISHPADTGSSTVTVQASETLRAGEGICHNQAALLVALYRAAGIPAALRYQEIETETGQKVLHGIATVWAPYLSETGGFVLVDPRYPESDPRHSGHEWQTRALQPPFERNLPMIHTDMLPVVALALQEATDAQELLRDLPRTLN